MKRIDFQTDPSRWRHWRLLVEERTARLIMDVDETGGLEESYELKLNSYDLAVDIELADAVQRLRFEHPTVSTVILESGKERVFCAGANIRMLAGATHGHKVNFCKFTNETRNMIEASGREAGQHYVCAVRGSCAGGGYELALACDEIVLADDRSSSVALPEMPLLAVLPGTGGLTRLTDKRKVRRDHADVFCSIEEGIKGRRAKEWRFVDELAPVRRLYEIALHRAEALAASSRRPSEAEGVPLTPLERLIEDDRLSYSVVEVVIDRAAYRAEIEIRAPVEEPPRSVGEMDAECWLIRAARELDDAILHLRFNEPEIGLLLFRTSGDAKLLLAHEALLENEADHWLTGEIRCLWTRVLERIDLTSRSLVALIEPGSCFAGILAEIAFACDRSYMADGDFEGDDRPRATLTLSAANFGAHPMTNDLTRLETRFLGEPETLEAARGRLGEPLEGADAARAGLVTFAFDDIDFEDEVRIFLEERASFSPDALTGMEANLRFAGPETMRTRIFGRLTAWQNWIFQRPNAVGENGALARYGTGQRAELDRRRV